jgi:hypothetical protein
VIPTAPLAALAKSKPVTLDPRGGPNDNNSIVGIVEGTAEVDGARVWIFRAPRGDLRARLSVPAELDARLVALVGRLARVWVDKAGVYHAEPELAVHARAPRLSADRDDPSARYKP